MLKVIVFLLCRGLSASAFRAAFVVALNLLLAVLLAGCPPVGRFGDDDGSGEVDSPDYDNDGDGWTENGGDCDDSNGSVYVGALERCDGLDNDCDGLVPATGPGSELDADEDGWRVCAGDCNDGEPAIHPGADELIGDGWDNDCDGQVDDGGFDDDGDGAAETLPDGTVFDCDDDDPSVYPGAPELCDGLDNNCDGVIPDAELDEDEDGDTVCDGDCDDSDAVTHPGAPERCDAADNDCDGLIPADEWDPDGDGFAECQGDCGVTNPNVYPGAPERCNGVDDDCNGQVPGNEADADSDNVRICQGDCDDSDADAFPGAPELCNGVDDNCNGQVPADEWDPDGDGFRACAGDCAPADPTVNPGAPEVCDGFDNNCDGLEDETFADADGDGNADCVDGDMDGDGFVNVVDCSPANASVYPGAPEIPDDGIDQDCNGTDAVTCFADSDGDGFGASSVAVSPFGSCESEGFSSMTGDCSDVYPGMYPGAIELCDGVDNDCDDLIDEGTGTCPFTDADGDGWPGATDCAPTNPAVFPGAPEVPDDGIDQNCNGADTVTCFVDNDGDGFGASSVVLSGDGECTDSGESEVDGDCMDAVADVNPAAVEACDGLDTDCDGNIPPGEMDSDGDGAAACEGDCDDTNAAIFPGAPEILDDDLDQDCSGADSVTCFVDNDGDGFGGLSAVTGEGGCPTGTVLQNGDCQDFLGTVYPGATEQCDGQDNDCDGLEDETFADADGDGNADCIDPDSDGDGFVNNLDCSPNNAAIYPGAPEIPDDGIDQNCNGADTVTCFVDNDGDGFGASSVVLSGDGECTDSGESEVDGDCMDAVADVNPAAVEACDGLDTDCDGNIPPGEMDSDGDGAAACEGDCDDTNAAIFPGAPEILDDDLDQDCSGADSVTCWLDADGDDFGGSSTVTGEGVCPTGSVPQNGDCNDAVATINPGAPEVCDGLDNDCDDELQVDETDFDGDAFLACEGDCDDDDLTVYPGAPELCDDLDNDCDGAVPLGETPVGPQAYQACAQNQEDGVDGLTPDGVDEDGNGCDVDGFALADGECMAEYTMSLHPVWGIPVSVPGVQASAMSFNDWQDWTEEMGAWIPDLDLWVESCGGGNPYPYGPGNIDGACPVASSPGVPTPVLTDDYEDSCTSPWGMVQSLGGNSWEFVELPDGTWGMVGGSAQAYRPTCTTLGYSEGGYAGSPVHPNSDAPAESRFAMDPLP